MSRTRSLALPVLLAALLALLMAAATIAAAAPARATAPSCATPWGSLTKTAGGAGWPATITDVRAGRHACFDRMVVDLAGAPGSTGYHVRYVDVVRMDGSGFAVPTRGGAALEVIARAPAYDDMGNPTYDPANRRELVDVRGFDTFRQIADAGSYEGQTTFALGVRARLPFRVIQLESGPGSSAGSRLVIDVAHHW